MDLLSNNLLEAKLSNIGRKGHVQLRVANALWPQKGYPFLEEFLALTKQYYGVLITPAAPIATPAPVETPEPRDEAQE